MIHTLPPGIDDPELLLEMLKTPEERRHDRIMSEFKKVREEIAKEFEELKTLIINQI